MLYVKYRYGNRAGIIRYAYHGGVFTAELGNCLGSFDNPIYPDGAAFNQ